MSYAIGYFYGVNLADVPFNFNTRVMFQGLVNAFDGSVEIMNEDDLIDVLDRFFGELEALHRQDFEDEFLNNVEAGIRYMEENAQNPDVTTTESGIQYRVIKAGNGRRTQENSTVRAHYTGRFLNGDVFDSSHLRDEPMTFEISSVIDGWYEGLKLMREGDIYELVIPYHLAYGEVGYDIIEAGSTLIFEIELIEVVGN